MLDAVDVVSVHGFPLDWNHWNIHEWPRKIDEIRAVARGKAVWVSEAGASSFGAEEVQIFGLQKTAELLLPLVERVHWYSLFDLPSTWTATTRHREAEGSAYYRHYYMGLIREDGSAKPAAAQFPAGHGDLPVVSLSKITGWTRPWSGCASWECDICAPASVGLTGFGENSELWFDRQMEALTEFDTTMTLCFTPEHLGMAPHYTSPPKNPGDFAEFAAWAVEPLCSRKRERASRHRQRPSPMGAPSPGRSKRMTAKRILVTGGAGFVGSHTVDALVRAGHKVRVFDNLDPQVHPHGLPAYLRPEVEMVRGDVRDAGAVRARVRGSEVIYHLAAAVGVGQSMYEIAHYMEANTQGTANLLQALLDDKLQFEKLIVASSMSIYGEGQYRCPEHGEMAPPPRASGAIAGKKWEVQCPACAAEMEPVATPKASRCNAPRSTRFPRRTRRR